MNIKKLSENYGKLIQHLQQNKYSKAYIRRLKTEIKWLICNNDEYRFLTYKDAYRIRGNCTVSKDMKRWYRLAYGIIMRFDIYDEYPDRTRKEPLIKRDAYSQLNATFKEVIDLYMAADEMRGLKKYTIKNNASKASCFFLAMQDKGFLGFDEIKEVDVMSFFTDEEGEIVLSSSYKKAVASVLKSHLGIFDESSKRILAYLPILRPKRKNIQYLTPEEVNSIHQALSDGNTLSLRDKAIGLLLFFTGIRGCDIAQIEFSDIDWDKEEIRINQQKTSNSLILPLTITVGNAIYDYIVNERPKSIETTHIFLNEVKPYIPVKPKTMWNIASKIYKEAGVRQNLSDKRGTHLFRYNLVTSLAGNNIARPIISDILGHSDPNSLDYYLFADMVHLRECALSIENFPINEEVFRL
jgi:integrase